MRSIECFGWLAGLQAPQCPLAAVSPGHSHHQRPCCRCRCAWVLAGCCSCRARWRMRCCRSGCTLAGEAAPCWRCQGHCQRCACCADRSAPILMSSGTVWLAKSLCSGVGGMCVLVGGWVGGVEGSGRRGGCQANCEMPAHAAALTGRPAHHRPSPPLAACLQVCRQCHVSAPRRLPETPPSAGGLPASAARGAAPG